LRVVVLVVGLMLLGLAGVAVLVVIAQPMEQVVAVHRLNQK
jgi:hypothetical protein